MRTFAALFVILLLATPALAETAATAKTQYADINGTKIAYRSIGKGSPILLANRMRGTIDTWDPLFLDELARKHRVITFDYPGVGYSNGTLPTELSDVAKVVAGLANNLKIDRFAMMGWSWGGLVAQTVVVDFPQRVTHAVLIGTTPPGEGQAAIQQVWIERALKPVNDLADEEILFFEPKSEASLAAAKASHDRIYARPDVVSKIPSKMEEFQAFFKAGELYRGDRAQRRERLKKSDIPMLILCGDNDTSVPATNWYPLIGHIPRAQLIVLPRSGHGPQHQYPLLSSRYILEFLASPEV